MNNKEQVPITEQKHILLTPELSERVDEIKASIADTFEQLEDDDINMARAIWRELNATLIHAFSLGVFDIYCADCGHRWAVAKRQALNEYSRYRDRLKRCPECDSNDLRLDFELQLQIRGAESRRHEAELRAKIENAAESLDVEEAQAAAEAASGEVTPS